MKNDINIKNYGIQLKLSNVELIVKIIIPHAYFALGHVKFPPWLFFKN